MMAPSWSNHDTQLIVATCFSLAAIVVLIGAFRIVPFFSILIGSFVAGLSGGVPLDEFARTFTEGAGHLLGDAGTIIALGAMLGALVAESGAADRIVTGLLRFGKGSFLPWMMALVAIVVGLPLFFEVGLVLMAPVIFVMARRSEQPILKIAIPTLAGLTALHALLPPHPGPLIAVRALHADLGMTMALGLVAAIPAVILAGPLYGNWLSSKMSIGQPQTIGRIFESKRSAQTNPGFVRSLFVMLLPVILMLGSTVAKMTMKQGSDLARIIDFIGEPVVALSITVAVAILTLGWLNGLDRRTVGESLRKSLAPIAVLLLTIGAGGGLQRILVVAGISDTITKVGSMAHIPLIMMSWLVAVIFRQATGSATVATTATAGIVAPLVGDLSVSHHSLVALAIGAGSVFFCHVNDAGFWMVREYFDLNLVQALKVWSVLQTIVSVMGFVVVLVLWQFLA